MTPLEKSASILVKAKADIVQTLEGHEHEAVGISIISSITGLINKLNHLTGMKPSEATLTKDFEPVTEFFGKPINRPIDIVKADLSPSPTDKDIFLSKVNKLQSEFETLSADQILNSYSRLDDVLVIRGVAKRAGVKEYENAVINIAFIDAIKAGLQNKKLAEIRENEINKELAKPAAPATEAAGIQAVTDQANEIHNPSIVAPFQEPVGHFEGDVHAPVIPPTESELLSTGGKRTRK